MYYANCEWYVDMGEHNKPLCERKGLRPAKCSECPVYIRSIEKENAKLRELCTDLSDRLMDKDKYCGECRSQCEHDAWNFGDPKCVYAKRMRELGVEVNYRWQG